VTGINGPEARFDPQRRAAENRAAVAPVRTGATPTEVWRCNTQDGGAIPPIRQGGRARGASSETQVGRAAQGAPVTRAAAAARVDVPASGAERPARGGQHKPEAKAHDGSEPFGFPLPWLAPAGGDAAASAMMPLSPQRLLDLQQDYLQRVGSMWTTFFRASRQGERADQGPAFLRPGVAEESLASLYARAYLLNAGVPEQDGRTPVEMDRKTKSASSSPCSSGSRRPPRRTSWRPTRRRSRRCSRPAARA